MRRENLSENHLKLYCTIAISCCVLVTCLLGLTWAGAFWGAHVVHSAGLYIGLSGVLAVTTVAILLIGYFALRDSVRGVALADQQTAALAHRDSLTGAWGRASFLDKLKGAVRQSAVHPVGYIHVDMDNLKQLNDGRGHPAGDAGLVHLVSTIQEILPEAIIGRLGGDEFGVMVAGYENKSAIKRVCDQILQVLSVPIVIEGRPTRIGATMGLATAPVDARSTDELVSKADLALYSGKTNGRGSCVVYDEDMNRDERHKRFIEREFRAAILMNELELYYQPIVMADGLELKSYEALIRWRHSVRGIIPPSEFIHIAEQSDLIDKLGDWVLARACADLEKLNTPCVSINVSVVQLRDSDFAERFSQTLEKYGVPGEKIIVEVTETVPLASGGTEKANLDALRALDVRIAIDDFGAGNASLSYLKSFSFDVLKIDRSYVIDIVNNRMDALVVASVCRLARAAGMSVVAEGIETQEQLDALKNLGCNALQGYLLGRPQPLHKILEARPSISSSISPSVSDAA